MDNGLLKTSVAKFLSDVNLLRKGTAKFEIDGEEVIYKGLLDFRGRAHGHGEAIIARNIDYSWTGTFKDNKPHGLMLYKVSHHKFAFTCVQEFNMGVRHGKSTFYINGGITNYTHDNGRETSKDVITDNPHDAYYSKMGKAVKALTKLT